MDAFRVSVEGFEAKGAIQKFEDYNPETDLLANSVFYVLDKLVHAYKNLTPYEKEELKRFPRAFISRFAYDRKLVTLPDGILRLPFKLNFASDMGGRPADYTRIIRDETTWTLKFKTEPPLKPYFNEWPCD